MESTGEMGMKLQLDTTEYQVEEETSRSSIRYEVSEMLREAGYLENFYEQKESAIRRRKSELLWSFGIRLLTGGILVGLMAVFNTWSHPAFGWTAVILLGIFAALCFISAARTFLSWCTHKGLFAAPLRFIRNRTYERKMKTRLSGGLYTLKQEEEDCIRLKRQFEKDKQSLRSYLEQPEAAEEQGRQLLEDIRPRWKEEDRQADYLYGELI